MVIKSELISKIKELQKDVSADNTDCYDDHGNYFDSGKAEAYEEILELLEKSK